MTTPGSTPFPPPADKPRDEPTDKQAWRGRLLAARRALAAELCASEAALLRSAVVATAQGITDPICCFVPTGEEPGSTAMLDALRTAGHEVLLPVVPTDRGGRPGPRGPMNWAPYRGVESMAKGPYGLFQPGGPGWGPAAVATAGLVLVPALAVDHRGVRLGRGAGWYDRTLPLARPGTPLVAMVRDGELVPTLPMERHDVLMTGVLTPHHGLRALPLGLD
ncbi:MAG TPA: 5-formyltetrahydrofolate cyclo-ligase [Pseudonocardia sp.]|jgi:5-formyltetrahydrofolate cyclo-ligase|nr:5-formyltetrahydrofolate cyclo-ligase [Pseudonocardia sp.]